MRQALNLPPANRPPLGKGPTGKDKPKSFDGGSTSHHIQSSRGSSSAESPDSTRTNSLSPTAMTSSMPSRSSQVLEGSQWDQTIIMTDQQSDMPGSSTSATFQLPPMSAPLPSKSLQYASYSMPSSSRNSMPSMGYMNSQANQINYPHSGDRPMGSSYSSQGFSMRGELRDESRTQQYNTYPYQSHDTNMHPQSPPSTAASMQSQPQSQSQSHSHHGGRETTSPSGPFPHRRSLTEPQGYSIGQGFPHLPNPLQSHHNIRLPSPPRLQDNGSGSVGHHRQLYGPDGRVGPMP